MQNEREHKRINKAFYGHRQHYEPPKNVRRPVYESNSQNKIDRKAEYSDDSELLPERAGAYCLQFAYYNFCRIRRTIRVTPAMEAGIADHPWEIAELLA